MSFIRIIKAAEMDTTNGDTFNLNQKLDDFVIIVQKYGKGIIIKFLEELKLNNSFIQQFDNDMIEHIDLNIDSIYNQIKREDKIQKAEDLLDIILRDPESYILK